MGTEQVRGSGKGTWALALVFNSVLACCVICQSGDVALARHVYRAGDTHVYRPVLASPCRRMDRLIHNHLLKTLPPQMLV